MDRPRSDFGPIETMMMRAAAWRAVLHSLRLGLFDVLEQGPVPAGRLAERLGFQPVPTEALLELLVAYGLLVHGSDGYGNSPMASEFLVSVSPFFQGQALELNNSFNAFVDHGFHDLLRGVSSARQATDKGWSMEDAMRGTEQYARLGSLQDAVDFVAGLPGFMDMALMCDVGGNHGAFSMALLDRNPSLRGDIADLPAVAAAADKRIADLGYAHRLTAFGCDLGKDTLPGERYDLVLASHVLYGLMDDLGAILAMVCRALRPGGWFVSQHMDPDGGMGLETARSMEFLTRMAGYASHFIPCGALEKAMRGAGFRDFRMVSSGHNGVALIVAGRKA